MRWIYEMKEEEGGPLFERDETNAVEHVQCAATELTCPEAVAWQRFILHACAAALQWCERVHEVH